MNIVICDDEKLFLSSIEQKINTWAEKNGHTKAIITHRFTSSEDMLDAWEHGMQVDAVFLDIQIPGELNGLAVAKQIRETNDYLPIVFITSYGQYAEEGYVVNAMRYLHKPVTQDAIEDCMNLIWRRWTLQHSDCVLLDLPNQILCLPVSSILYAEISGHTCSVQTTSRSEPYLFRQSMTYIQKKLSSALFVQCHRSFLVNLMYIRHITGHSLIMADGKEIPLGRKYLSAFMTEFRRYYLKGDGVES